MEALASYQHAFDVEAENDEAHDEWVAHVLGPILEALQEIVNRNNYHKNLIKEQALKEVVNKALKIVHEYIQGE